MRVNQMVAIAAGLLLSGAALAGGPIAGDGKNELDSMQREIGRFEEASKDYRGTVTHIVQREYVEKRRELMARYQSQLDKEESEEKSRRAAAIVMFENFLARYGHDDRW